MEVIKNRLRKITPITVEDKVWGIRRNLVETEIKVAPFNNEADDCKFTKWSRLIVQIVWAHSVKIVEKQQILSRWKKDISWNPFFGNNVAFTKFLPKKCKSTSVRPIREKVVSADTEYSAAFGRIFGR